ncbi:MAG: T9SS type A sorting domain-containing protein [Ignavibacteriales bacterium]|nr:MAG: T9SS type A sorting domain-containing protein [Ignavibacteriales bacterium]
MTNKLKIYPILKSAIIFQIIFSSFLFAQIESVIQRYRDDQKGSINNRRQGTLDGNLVRTLFYTNGEVGKWSFHPSGEWPIGSGHSYLSGVAVLIAAEVMAPGNSQTIHPLETSYREWMDPNPPIGIEKWGLEPVEGYAKIGSTFPALTLVPSSWPDEWPDALGLSDDWDGHWYGYFGKDVFNADLESFFVVDDSKDKEWSRSPYNYYPIASDTDRAGLGLRVEVRSFQWNAELLEDIIFWNYDVINISDYDYEKTCFGIFTDSNIGGFEDTGDDCASVDSTLALAYYFDYDGLGSPGNWVTGYMGYAYLQSPGNVLNGIDDDGDGMIDERIDDGIDNDADWRPFDDLNLNGVWDPQENEPLNDDLGVDGIGPENQNYNGPDLGEGDGLPTNGEPNFDLKDNHESDQIGLTAASIYRLGEGGTGGGWPKDDEPMWLKMSSGTFDSTLQNGNMAIVLSSGTFPFKKWTRQRYSMALMFGNDPDDLIFNKKVAQAFYNNNYVMPDSITSVDDEKLSLPTNNFILYQNYPNPFNPITEISFYLPVDGMIKLTIYDVLGREVKIYSNEFYRQGEHKIQFDGSELSSGIYFYKLSSDDFSQTKKFILLK